MTEPGPSVDALLAGLARLDNRPGTIDAMQRGLDQAWGVLDTLAALEAEGWRFTP